MASCGVDAGEVDVDGIRMHGVVLEAAVGEGRDDVGAAHGSEVDLVELGHAEGRLHEPLEIELAFERREDDGQLAHRLGDVADDLRQTLPVGDGLDGGLDGVDTRRAADVVVVEQSAHDARHARAGRKDASEGAGELVVGDDDIQDCIVFEHVKCDDGVPEALPETHVVLAQLEYPVIGGVGRDASQGDGASVGHLLEVCRLVVEDFLDDGLVDLVLVEPGGSGATHDVEDACVIRMCAQMEACPVVQGLVGDGAAVPEGLLLHVLVLWHIVRDVHEVERLRGDLERYLVDVIGRRRVLSIALDDGEAFHDVGGTYSVGERHDGDMCLVLVDHEHVGRGDGRDVVCGRHGSLGGCGRCRRDIRLIGGSRLRLV